MSTAAETRYQVSIPEFTGDSRVATAIAACAAAMGEITEAAAAESLHSGSLVVPGFASREAAQELREILEDFGCVANVEERPAEARQLASMQLVKRRVVRRKSVPGTERRSDLERQRAEATGERAGAPATPPPRPRPAHTEPLDQAPAVAPPARSPVPVDAAPLVSDIASSLSPSVSAVSADADADAASVVQEPALSLDFDAASAEASARAALAAAEQAASEQPVATLGAGEQAGGLDGLAPQVTRTAAPPRSASPPGRGATRTAAARTNVWPWALAGLVAVGAGAGGWLLLRAQAGGALAQIDAATNYAEIAYETPTGAYSFGCGEIAPSRQRCRASTSFFVSLGLPRAAAAVAAEQCVVDVRIADDARHETLQCAATDSSEWSIEWERHRACEHPLDRLQADARTVCSHRAAARVMHNERNVHEASTGSSITYRPAQGSDDTLVGREVVWLVAHRSELQAERVAYAPSLRAIVSVESRGAENTRSLQRSIDGDVSAGTGLWR